jgi:2-iminobutanoate/2-iminopropanoate deaminase
LRRQVSTEAAARPGGAYSQGIAAGGFLYTAGFGPQDPATGQVVAGGVAEQTHQVLRNIEALLATEGLDLSDVVKATVHLHELDRDFPAFNEAYASHFQPPYPVRTTVGSRLLGILVEIDVVAAYRDR